MIFGIDFDGTCVDHRYPDIGPDVPDAVFVLGKLAQQHSLILLTMRGTETDYGDTLMPAVEWFRDRDLPLHGVNENPDQLWTNSRKVYAQRYIDDSGLGIPLIEYAHFRRPCVLWKSNSTIKPGVFELLKLEGCI